MSYGDPSRYITQIHLAQDCQDSAYAQEIIERAQLPVTLIDPHTHPEIVGEYPENLTRGKHHLLLCRYRGRFFKACPGTKSYRCCGYQVLNIGMHCPMDCVYCILQAYLNNPYLSFFVNTDDLFHELDQALTAEPERLFRVGTGEFTDSLALDRLTGLSRQLVAYAAKQPRLFFELKTKSDMVDNLLDLEHGGKTVLAWSLNTAEIVKAEEIRAANLEERLAAAARCSEQGYPLAFHFDPIIAHPGWEQGYAAIIEQLFDTINPEQIVWISMGALRYLPRLKEIAGDRFPQSRFFYHEFITGLDGKARYFRDERVVMYQAIHDLIQKRMSPRTCLYFCMESDEIWQSVFGYTPEEKGGLTEMLDQSLDWSP